jgi:hypothetical protein
MHAYRWPGLALAAGLAVIALVGVPQSAWTEDKHLEQFSAFAVNLPGARPGDRAVSGVLQITIDRWSTAAERNALIDAFTKKGQDGLRDELSKKKPTGYIKLPNTLGYDMRFARQIPGRRIIIATDRLMTAREAINQPRTVEYPFTVIELRVNRNNVGEGALSALTRITANKKKQVIEIENYGEAPARLTEVKPLS